MSYEDVDTSLIPPRPRLYGLVGAEIITEVFKERRQHARPTPDDGKGTSRAAASQEAALTR
jgi:succinate dehydrogenase / fumarate reductase flavoprotein subunit